MNLVRTEWCSKDELLLHCPVCNDEHVHLMAAIPYDGTDTEKRPAVSLKFNCENGEHEFTVDIINHKGYSVVTTNVSKELKQHP